MSQDSRTQPRVPQPPGLDPLSKVQSLSRDISKGIPAHVKKSVIASNAIDDFNPAKKHEVSDRSKNIDDTNSKNETLPVELELQFHSQKQPDKADETRPIPVTERFKHFHDAFNALGRSYVSDPLARERASLQTRNVSRPRPNYRRAGKDAANKLQTENRQHVSKLNKVGQSQMKAQIKGVSHPDNNDMDETYEEYMSRKQRREREIFEAESARIQEENERLVLGDPYPTAKALASHNITVGPLDMMEEDLISFSPIKPKEPSRSRYLDLPIDEEKTRDLLNYKLPESESFATFAFSLRNAADHGNGNNSLAYSQRMASNNEFPNSQSKHSATSNQNIYDRDKHLSEEQLNALRGFSKQLHDVL